MNKRLQSRTNNKAFSLVEIIIAASIFTLAVVAFVFSFDVLRSMERHTAERTAAGLLLEESGEAMLLLRDFGWTSTIEPLSFNTPYYLYWDGSSYQLSEEEVASNGYVRRITLSPAYRDGTGSLAGSGTEDPATRRVLIEIINLEDGEVLTSAEMLIHNSYE